MPNMSTTTSPWRTLLFLSTLFTLFNLITCLPTNIPAVHYATTPVLGPPPEQHIRRRQDGSATLEPRINANFPDPSILRDEDGRWVAFATSGNGHHVQVATTDDPFGEWTLLDQDALPGKAWTSGKNFWAPDVRMLPDGSYIMYFSGQLPQGRHCVGAARSKTSTGPYTMDPEPLICPREEGGAIDPAGFYDESTGKRYIVYKVDGNAVKVGNPTPIRLQRVSTKDGTTLIGEPVTIMDRIAEQDGPLVEAPSLIRLPQGGYLLFFSSHWFTDNQYDVKYAVSQSDINGPYVRGQAPFLKTPALGLKGPGGGTSSEDGGFMVFHARCAEKKRCMYAVGYGII